MYRDCEVSTKFTANKTEETTPATDNPATADNVFKYLITLLISMVSIVSGGVYYKKKHARE